jgi:cyclic pyranopterin phosphate synthase
MGVNCLRISVTDRCNLRCVYCHPPEDSDFIQNDKVLTFDEIHRIVHLFADCGIERVRLTGGEPLLRRDLTLLVARLAAIEHIRELTLTTNGVRLKQMAGELKAAGLDRVNISVDSLEANNYKQVTGRDVLSRVVEGIHEALEVGLQPVRINAVILRGVNHSQIPALAKMSIDLPVTVRFIEYCPTSKGTPLADDYMPYSEIRSVIERALGPLSDATIRPGNGPALYFKIKGAAGAIGFIAGRSTTFCRSCNRVRLSSDGKIRPCLYSDYTHDIGQIMRNGASDEHIRNVLAMAIRSKHAFTRLNSSIREFSMRKVGG